MAKAKKSIDDYKFDNPAIINVEDIGTGLCMFDKLTRIAEGRRVFPFDQSENVIYLHRGFLSDYNLQIGDTCFMIPPEFIMVSSEATSQSMVTLRQENTIKERSGFHKRTILVDLVFSGLEQINGYKVESPEPNKPYYVDGLRQLLAQFKCTPFLPISNELINGVYGIFTVVLQSITMSTVPGFPDMMTAQITLQEVDMFPYIEMPSFCFEQMIDWDLFRFYYQRLLTENHEYKKLQSLPSNKQRNHFKLSILDESIFYSDEATEYNLLQLLCDQKIVKEGDGNTNYTLYLDSAKSDCYISSFQCGYANLLTNIQLSDCGCPTVQFMGGMDTIYNISFETTDYQVVQALERCRIVNDNLTRNNGKFHSLGFVKLESELVSFTGSLFVMIESVTTNTVPGFPNLYNVTINCVSYDISQSQREELTGFRPFECNNQECINNEFEPTHTHGDGKNNQTIEQSMTGLQNKIKQDNYAEWKLRTEMEVYPDLRLPKYSEVNTFINQCNAFRTSHGLEKLPYDEYPVRPVCMLHGSNPNNTISISKDKDGIIDGATVNASTLEYNVYVDPDFYVFYPWSYKSFEATETTDGLWYDSYKTKTRDSVTKKIVREQKPLTGGATDTYDGGGFNTGNSSIIEEFISVCESQLGCTYKMVNEADGRLKDSNGRNILDCSGLITYALRQIGVMSQSDTRLTVANIANGKHSKIFKEVSWSEKRRGDCLVKYGNGSHHVVVYKGGDSIIHASSGQGKVVNGKQYFTENERVFRPLAFDLPALSSESENSVTDVVGTGKDAVWNALKSYGLSDYACAGIMGNMVAESNINSYNVQGSWKYSNQDEYNKNYVAQVDSGAISRYDFVNNGPGGGGFGLVQFTYHTYKAELYDLAKSQGKSVADVGVQIAVFINQIKANGVFDQLNNASSVKDASNIMLLKYERPADQSVGVQNKRAGYSQSIYSQYAGAGGNNNSDSVSGPSISTDEFESICRIIMAETEGLNSSDAQKALAQLIYDKLNSNKFGGLGNILNDRGQFAAPANGDIPQEIKNIVTSVFCDGSKYWSDWTAMAFLTPDSNISSYKINDNTYDRIKPDVSIFSFWGVNSPGSDIKYVISDTSNSSSNNKVFTGSVTYEAVTVDVDAFAEPILVETDAIIYDEDTWAFWVNPTRKSNAKKALNHSRRIFGSSFVNEAQYSSRGRLVRAFPAYLFCVLDDQCQWYDGRKLWTNYYIHKSVVDIAVHETNDMPTSTATITVSNVYHNLSRTQGGLASYSVKDDLNWLQTQWYNLTGLVWDLGSPNLTDKMIQLHQVIYSHARLREGARIHLRMGYGSDPLSLAPMINGHISDITIGDQVNIVVTSDGSELIQHITSANEKDTNNGWFGLFGLGEVQEASNIIAHIMCKRQSWANVIVGSWFEGSKYSIEHFGLYFNQSLMQAIVKISTGAAVAVGAGVGAAVGSVVPGLGTLFGMSIGAALGLAGSIIFDDNINISDIWNEYQEQYDIMKNVYKASYEREHYIYSDFLGWDGEDNIVFNQYNMTPWDVFQMCAQTAPEYIVKPSMHQFDSRLYFGLPFWMEKYRYNYLNNHVYEECKSASQMHMVDSLTNIIDNQIRVTSKYSNTNVKVMYTCGKSPTSTQTIHSDDTIDYSKQKTGIIESSITQDALGPDKVYEFLGYNIGEEAARKLGISNLLYGWQQQYQGQIICTGMPGVNAHDYFMIYDTYRNIYGLALVREVVHSFGVNTGFTTSITPGMIGFSTDNQSGMVEVCKNYLNLLNLFSSFLYTRNELKNNYEKNINLFSEMYIMEKKAQAAIRWNTAYRIAGGFPQQIFAIAGYTVLWNTGLPILKVNSLKFTLTETIKNLRNVKKLQEAGGNFLRAAKGLWMAEKATDGIKVVRGIKNITTGIKAIQAGTTAAAGTIVPGVGAIVAFAIWTIVDILIGELIQWLSNKNVVCLLPLWWENSTFVSGVKDGTKILLCNGNSNSTTETKKGLGDKLFFKTSDADMHEGENPNPSEDNDD